MAGRRVRTGRGFGGRVRLMGRASLLLSVLVVAGTTVVATVPAAQAATVPAPRTAAAPGAGYWTVGADGGIFSFGSSGFHGSMGGVPLNAPIVGMAATPSSNGYWEVAADGGVFAFGDASFFGSMGGTHLNAPIVGMAATPTGQGYWLVASDGGIFAFGDATFNGSMGGSHLNKPIVGMVATPTGNGYWLVASDGGVFSFGDATFHGSMGGEPLNAPIVGIASSGTGSGYWMVASDGGIFSFGDAAFLGSMGGQPLNKPIVGMSVTSDGRGYWLVASDGGIFSFGDAAFHGSMGGQPLNRPIVGMAPVGATVGGKVLLVGKYDGIPGQYTTIQAAVDAAQPGDWILVAPGDYHENADFTNPPTLADANDGWYGGVEISTSNLHLRGMDRNSVIVDGTNASASTPCSSNPADQNFGNTVAGKTGPIGRNGIVVWNADNVSIQNLTVCNFLTGSGSAGNEVWWDGNPGSGHLGITGYRGSYLTATSTYYASSTAPAAAYGIFSSGAAGPGVWNQLYASNMNDSGMYVGACRQACDAWIHNAWMEYSALGYSGTNSGGILTVQHSQFDNNQDGFDTNTQIASDPPPPQNGACPDGGTSALSGTGSCWVFDANSVHDNNNPNAPKVGYAGAGPVGTGMTVSGGRNDTVMDNTFANNGAWGTLFLPFVDNDTPPAGVTCANTGGTGLGSLGCLYDAQGDALRNNTYVNNGFFGNPTNGDYANLTFSTGIPQNCFAGNVAPDGSTPANLEQTNAVCGVKTTSANFSFSKGTLGGEVLCDSGLLGPDYCLTTDRYPQATTVTMHPLPSNLPTMPNPCAGVPANAWCPANKVS